MRRLVMVLAVAASLLLAAPAWADIPNGDFTVSPAVGQAGQELTFTPSGVSDPDLPVAGIKSVAFQWTDDGEFQAVPPPYNGVQVKHTYATPGEKTVTMRIVDLTDEVRDVVKEVRINDGPLARFVWSPPVPNVGETITFNAAASEDDKEIPADGYRWDLNGTGGFEAAGRIVRAQFATAGNKRIRLQVTDSDGQTNVAAADLHVNAPPSASFIFLPRAPYVNEAIDFTSISDDPDDPIVAEEWDLDGDGQYDDATGKTASRSFATAGAHVVRLRVRDSRGRTNSVAATVNVLPLGAAVPDPPRKIRPWPTIRVVGTAKRARTRIDLLTVTSLRGAVVRVKCKGRSCPRSRAVSTRSRGRLVRLKFLERRLRAGTKITITVTMPNKIGRHTTLTVRRGKAPKRRTLCLWPGVSNPRKCS